MAQPAPKLQFQVQSQILDTNTNVLDEDNFYHQRQGTPSELTSRITYMLGDYTKRYPLMTMTLGAGGYNPQANSGAREIDDPQFTYPVMGALDKASIVAKTDYTGVDKPGIAHGEFYLYFPDNYIKRFYFIRSHKGTLAYVKKDPDRVGGVFKYTCEIASPDDSAFVDPTETYEGAAWIGMWTGVPESKSLSTTTNMVMPGLYKNQMNFMRLGMSWAGNTANKIMRFTMKTGDGSETSAWMDWFMYQFELEWLSMAEHMAWYSEYNRRIDGTVPLTDLVSGKVIMQGSGLLEQVLNRTTYTSLTYDLIQNIVGDALYGLTDSDDMVITFWGGKGFIREFDQAMKAKGFALLTDFTGVAEKFVTGTNRDLMLGGFFGGCYLVDGYTILVKHNPLFDHGKVAQAQRAAGYVHPVTGFPMESYRGVALDTTDYDGEPNIIPVAQKGRAFLHGIIPGLTPAPKTISIMSGYATVDNVNQAGLIANEVDQSGYTRFGSRGIQMRRGNRCFDLTCVAAG